MEINVEDYIRDYPFLQYINEDKSRYTHAKDAGYDDPNDCFLIGDSGGFLMNINPNDKVLRLSRIRMVNNDIIMYSISYVPQFLNLPLNAELYGSLYQLLATQNIQISHADEYIEAMLADDIISQSLEISVNDAVLKRTRISQDQYNRNVEYTTTYYRSDKYKYVVELTV